MTDEEIQAKILEWHAEEGDVPPLYKYLGWTREQYKIWNKTGIIPKKSSK